MVVARSLEKLKLTFEANKSPLEKWPCALFGQVVYGSLFREGTTVAFLKVGEEQP